MSLLVGGIVSVVLGVIGFSQWWSDFLVILKGVFPMLLILGGILAVYVGIDDMQDRLKDERQKQEEKLAKAREEIEEARAQADRYREEIDKLKGQSGQNTP